MGNLSANSFVNIDLKAKEELTVLVAPDDCAVVQVLSGLNLQPGREFSVERLRAFVFDQPGQVRVTSQKYPVAYSQSGGVGGTAGSGGGGTGYLGSVASAAAMTALDAGVGDRCLRTDVGVGGISYQCVALPASSAGNWQPLQGTLTDGSVVTLSLPEGLLPALLRVFVASGCQVTVSVDGVPKATLVENVPGQYSIFEVADDVASAQPTMLTIQRTAGSGTTSTYSLEF